MNINIELKLKRWKQYEELFQDNWPGSPPFTHSVTNQEDNADKTTYTIGY